MDKQIIELLKPGGSFLEHFRTKSYYTKNQNELVESIPLLYQFDFPAFQLILKINHA